MKRLENHLIGIDQGSVLLFSDFEDGGAMWNGTGPRAVRRSVRFSEPFRSPPSVLLGLEMWDNDQGSNQRGDIGAEAVTEAGFDIVFKTWGDTRIARLRIRWTALGPLAHDDDWQID